MPLLGGRLGIGMLLAVYSLKNTSPVKSRIAVKIFPSLSLSSSLY
jgi:hypothetical protein